MQKRHAGHAVTNLLLLLIIAALYLATVEPQAVRVNAPVYRGSSPNMAALQFTVDYPAAALPDILDTLQAAGAHATFAVSGAWAGEYPGLARRMAEEGHELATMGYNPAFDGKLSLVQTDIETSLRVIEQASGVRPTLYYSGTRGVAISGRAAKKLGLTQVLCTVDLLCARGTASDIVLRVSNEQIPGSILLMQPTRAAAGALGMILQVLDQKGITATTTSGVLGRA
ncbi:MAG: polysaccharide deacetylase family protein [Christensenellaceae bacterium]|jgi:peptidoglycan/xylan/chitin deacetylase (PgdA/CDA1 family)|nr:polysaccharide deacetylase family protein [Christensenellaceae bacterium]